MHFKLNNQEEIVMTNLDQNYETYENLNNTERAARVIVSTVAIVVAMGSSIAGTTMFAVISILGIALAMTGIVGWDPVRALSAKKTKHHVLPYHADTKGHGV